MREEIHGISDGGSLPAEAGRHGISGRAKSRKPEIGKRGESVSKRKGIDQPAEHDGGGNEAPEHQRPATELLARFLTRQRGEDRGHRHGKEDQQQEVAAHLRPTAISNASRITRKFKRPETIRKLLPYS